VPAPQALLAGLIGYGCANTAFAGLAIQLVLRRENGILKRLRATPLPPSTYVAALLSSTLIVSRYRRSRSSCSAGSCTGRRFPTRWARSWLPSCSALLSSQRSVSRPHR